MSELDILIATATDEAAVERQKLEVRREPVWMGHTELYPARWSYGIRPYAAESAAYLAARNRLDDLVRQRAEA